MAGMSSEGLSLPVRAAMAAAAAHGVAADRCEVLQNGSTVVVRLTETLVARVVADAEGPRRGGEWFERESAVAIHLAGLGAPVIPMHPQLPPGPHVRCGLTLNFWQFVTRIEAEPGASEVGATLRRCHECLESFGGELPVLAIPKESLALLDAPEVERAFDAGTWRLLRDVLSESIEGLEGSRMQPLHGDAHPGNLLNTTEGLLWTDWEDTFLGPVEWDLASIVWNARILDGDEETAEGIPGAYREAGGAIDEEVLERCLIARAAVMSAWYPVLYPDPSPERRAKLRRRLEWLAGVTGRAG